MSRFGRTIQEHRDADRMTLSRVVTAVVVAFSIIALLSLAPGCFFAKGITINVQPTIGGKAASQPADNQR